MKILKKLIILFLILIIQSFIVIYRIISVFWIKYNTKIKDFIKRLDKELRLGLQ